MRDWGYRVPLCQGYALSRKEGKSVAMFQEDMLCFEPVVGYGWAKTSQYFLDGYNRFPQDVKDLKAGKNYAADFPRLGTGKYKGVVSAPLGKVNFLLGMVLIYCNSAQLSLLLLGREYTDGHDLKCSLSSHAACVYGVVPVIQNKQCQVAIPCRGDRYFAMAGDDEIILNSADFQNGRIAERPPPSGSTRVSASEEPGDAARAPISGKLYENFSVK